MTNWKEVEEGPYVLCGRPKTVLEKLREGIKSLDCRILLTSFQLGNMPLHLAIKNMELFAREVMPYLREEFPEIIPSRSGGTTLPYPWAMESTSEDI